MTKLKDLTGQKFGRWTVVSEVARRDSKQYWNCVCDCGKTKDVAQRSILSGVSTSCGCSRDEETARRNFKHGVTTGCHRAVTPKTYNCWRGMKQRCQNPKNPKHKIYGARGITVCEQWQDFTVFLADMGECPGAGYSIDRINNDGNYEPSNCRWATVEQQMSNQSTNTNLTMNGVTRTIAQWSRELGLNYGTIIRRIYRGGWSVEKALTEPVHNGRH